MMRLFTKGFYRVFFALSVLALCLAFAGCSEEEKAKGEEKPQTKVEEKKAEEKKPEQKVAEKKVEELEVKVYFPNEEATKLFADKRTARLEKKDKYTAAMEALLEGPRARGQIAILPKQAKLIGVTVKDGIATVNFSRGLTKHFVGGSTAEEMLVASVVNTLTEFDEVKGVRFLVEGEAVESIGGHIDLTEPIKRMKNFL